MCSDICPHTAGRQFFLQGSLILSETYLLQKYQNIISRQMEAFVPIVGYRVKDEEKAF